MADVKPTTIIVRLENGEFIDTPPFPKNRATKINIDTPANAVKSRAAKLGLVDIFWPKRNSLMGVI